MYSDIFYFINNVLIYYILQFTKMLFTSVVFLVLFIILNIKSETIHLGLENGIRTNITNIHANDIVIHNFTCSTTQVVFFLDKTKGSPLMYSYHSYNALNFNPTADDIIALSVSDSLEKSKLIDTTMILKLNLLENFTIFSKMLL